MTDHCGPLLAIRTQVLVLLLSIRPGDHIVYWKIQLGGGQPPEVDTDTDTDTGNLHRRREYGVLCWRGPSATCGTNGCSPIAKPVLGTDTEYVPCTRILVVQYLTYLRPIGPGPLKVTCNLNDANLAPMLFPSYDWMLYSTLAVHAHFEPLVSSNPVARCEKKLLPWEGVTESHWKGH